MFQERPNLNAEPSRLAPSSYRLFVYSERERSDSAAELCSRGLRRESADKHGSEITRNAARGDLFLSGKASSMEAGSSQRVEAVAWGVVLTVWPPL
ncbi:hypothetical protein EYF80_038393 [Liparis tanakae]|uniref:Uncharacterized protein n=1 Tax=Liparis tanakae TaxID=230148 RepID=A0A4Z2GDS0_9TELE|nr:hypothetical protein EYF80_038393 [Liparis tanakae]